MEIRYSLNFEEIDVGRFRELFQICKVDNIELEPLVKSSVILTIGISFTSP